MTLYAEEYHSRNANRLFAQLGRDCERGFIEEDTLEATRTALLKLSTHALADEGETLRYLELLHQTPSNYPQALSARLNKLLLLRKIRLFDDYLYDRLVLETITVNGNLESAELMLASCPSLESELSEPIRSLQYSLLRGFQRGHITNIGALTVSRDIELLVGMIKAGRLSETQFMFESLEKTIRKSRKQNHRLSVFFLLGVCVLSAVVSVASSSLIVGLVVIFLGLVAAYGRDCLRSHLEHNKIRRSFDDFQRSVLGFFSDNPEYQHVNNCYYFQNNPLARPYSCAELANRLAVFCISDGCIESSHRQAIVQIFRQFIGDNPRISCDKQFIKKLYDSEVTFGETIVARKFSLKAIMNTEEGFLMDCLKEAKQILKQGEQPQPSPCVCSP